MTKKLIWRLKEQPTSESLRELVSAGLLSKDEAREVLFSTNEEIERDAKSLEAEIKFLRELVDKLAKNQTASVVETIRYIEKPYQSYPWHNQYINWCNGHNSGLNSSGMNCTSNFATIVTF